MLAGHSMGGLVIKKAYILSRQDVSVMWRAHSGSAACSSWRLPTGGEGSPTEHSSSTTYRELQVPAFPARQHMANLEQNSKCYADDQ